MKIKSGQGRVVLIAGPVAIKFPRIKLISAFKVCRDYIKGRRWKQLMWIFRSSWHSTFSISWLLFKGVMDNINEYRYYRKVKKPFLLPTYISFFGLVNIQKYSDPLQIHYTLIWPQILDATAGFARKDGHHFTNPQNFCIHNGGLALIDYGSQATQDVLDKYGQAIHAIKLT